MAAKWGIRGAITACFGVVVGLFHKESSSVRVVRACVRDVCVLEG